MKILILAIGANMGGAIRHSTNFFPELCKQDKKNEYYIYVNKSFPELKLNGNVHLVRVNKLVTEFYVITLLYYMILIPLLAILKNFKIIISILNFGPLWSTVPHILFQRNSLLYCDNFFNHFKIKDKITYTFRKFISIITIINAKVIVTPSDAMANQIKRKISNNQKRKFITIKHGLNSKDFQSNQRINVHRLDKATLFYASHLGDYKGFNILFEALAIIKKKFSNINLILTIQREENELLFNSYINCITSFGISDNVSIVKNIAQDKIINYYRKADLYVNPSICESFSYTNLEAMTVGLPLVISDIDVNKEICGDAAIYFSNMSAKDLADKILRVLSDSELRNLLSKKSLERVNSYDWSWERYVNEFLKLYDLV